MSKSSILEYLLSNAAERGEVTAALYKKAGSYVPVTWREFAKEAQRVSMGLIYLGVNPGERVGIICTTSLEWVVADMGILGAGGVTVPIYTSNLADECQYILEHSGCVVVFVEDIKQAEKINSQRSQLPHVRKVIQIRGPVVSSDSWIVSFEEFLLNAKDDPTEFESRRRGLSKDSVLTIMYTSGTTGRPKGAVLTHDCMLYEAEAVNQIKVINSDDTQLLWLPLAHVFAKVLEIAWLSVGHVMAFAESMETIKDNLAETKPTMMVGVPRLFEKFYAAVVQKGTASGGLKAKMFKAACEASRRRGELLSSGKLPGLFERAKFNILKRLVFTKIERGLKETMGGRLNYLISGGAPLAPQIAWFFNDAGIQVLEGWGLTETSAATCVNHQNNNTIGTVGLPMPGTELRIADDGEILVKGRGVMREYYRDPEATAEAFSDGWFHTGDIGRIDQDGKLRITDRKKDIIVTAGGKNVAPQNIENLLKTDKLISQVVVHGDKRKFLSALITLDAEALKKFAEANKLGLGSYAELTQRPETAKAVQTVIDGFNARLASYETIKRFKILETDFSIESGELTPSVKVRRKVINDRYRRVFDSFYDEQN